jgi:hypothetical protein
MRHLQARTKQFHAYRNSVPSPSPHQECAHAPPRRQSPPEVSRNVTRDEEKHKNNVVVIDHIFVADSSMPALIMYEFKMLYNTIRVDLGVDSIEPMFLAMKISKTGFCHSCNVV